LSYKQLYRSVTNRRIAGVAGGIAEYFGVDPTPIRLLWLLALLLGGSGFLAYIIAWIVIPEAPLSEASQIQPLNSAGPTLDQPRNPDWAGSQQRNIFMYIGIFLILLGGFFLLQVLLPWNITPYTWALFFIVLGVLLLIPHRKEPK
jgi:phage shock protein PspC (stress-responsive transcriptional regulator)